MNQIVRPWNVPLFQYHRPYPGPDSSLGSIRRWRQRLWGAQRITGPNLWVLARSLCSNISGLSWSGLFCVTWWVDDFTRLVGPWPGAAYKLYVPGVSRVCCIPLWVGGRQRACQHGTPLPPSYWHGLQCCATRYVWQGEKLVWTTSSLLLRPPQVRNEFPMRTGPHLSTIRWHKNRGESAKYRQQG